MMKNVEYVNALSGVLASLAVIVLFYKWFKHRRSNLPPGPWGLPFLGFLPFLSKQPFKDFRKLADKYGNVFSLNLGRSYTVVLNDFESVKEAFNNPAILDRPAYIFDFVPSGLGFAGNNGAEWTEQRRFAMKTLKDIGLGQTAWESSVESEVEDFVQLLEHQGGKPYDVYEPLSTSVSNNITSIILGKPLLRGDPRRRVVDSGNEAVIESFSSSNLAYHFPFFMQFLAKLGLSSQVDTFKKILKFHEFFKSELENRKKILPAERKDESFIDAYLKEMLKMKEEGAKTWFNETNLIGSAEALIIGGSDTSKAFLCWIFLAMAVYPDVQKKVQKEIDAVLGKDGKLPWSGRTKLPYTYATLLETNRWRTVGPLSLPHCSSEDTKIGGFDIPKGTNVFSNIYSIHNDSKYWKDPDTFQPERFLDRNGSLILHRLDSYAPFSLGRRICPSETVAMIELFHYFTAVMQRFDIRPLEDYPPNIDDGVDGSTFQPVRQKLRYIPRG